MTIFHKHVEIAIEIGFLAWVRNPQLAEHERVPFFREVFGMAVAPFTAG